MPYPHPHSGQFYNHGWFIKDVEELIPGKVWFARVNSGLKKPGKVWRGHLLTPHSSRYPDSQPFTFRGSVGKVTTWRGSHFAVKLFGWTSPFHSWGNIFVETEAEAERVLRAVAEVIR